MTIVHMIIRTTSKVNKNQAAVCFIFITTVRVYNVLSNAAFLVIYDENILDILGFTIAGALS